jgi:hypothetical protein
MSEAIEPPAVVYVAVATPEPAYAPADAPLLVEATPALIYPPSAPVRKEDFVTVDPKAACGVFVGCL